MVRKLYHKSVELYKAVKIVKLDNSHKAKALADDECCKDKWRSLL